MTRKKKKKRRGILRSAYALPLAAFALALGLYLLGWLSQNPGAAAAIGIVMLAAAALAVYLKVHGIRRRRLHFRTLGELLTLTPTQFEQEVATILAHLDYKRIRRVGRSGDLSADLTCQDNKGRSVVVQCKRLGPGHSVGSPAIQSFLGMQQVHHKAERGVFVTTSRFTKPAVDLGKRHNLLLIDGPALTAIALRVHRSSGFGDPPSPEPESAVPAPEPVSESDG